MVSKVIRCLVLSGVALPAMTIASAAQAQATGEAGDQAERSSQFDVIVVTAQKRSQDLQDVPIAVAAIGGETIASANIQGQIDLPKVTPNLNFTSNSGFASAYIRGVGTQFGNPGLEPSVSVYFDDIYVPRAGSALFNFADVERIEVLKGPQGTLYGRNATGGAIRIITKQPTDEFEARLSGTYGSYDTFIVDGTLNVPLADTLALRVSARHDENKGYVKNLNIGGDADGNTRGQNRNTEIYLAKLKYENGPLRVTLSGDYERKKDRESVTEANLFPGGPEQIGAVLGAPDDIGQGFYTYSNDGQDILNTKAYGGALRIDYDAGPATLSSITGYRSDEANSCADIDGTGAFVQPVCGNPKTRQFTQEVQIASNEGDVINYVAGLYYLKEKSGYSFFVRAGAFGPPVDANGTRVGLISSPSDNVRVESFAPYAQVDFDISDQLALSVGGRYTYERKELRENRAYLGLIGADGFPVPGAAPLAPSPICTTTSPAPCTDPGKAVVFRNVSFKGTLSYTPNDNILLYATVARGYKSGGLNLPALTFVSTVEPEKLDDYEIGWKTEFGPVRWNGSAFYYDYTNLQIALTNQATGGTDIRNAAAAEIYGVETDVTIIPADGFELGFGGSYTKSKYKDFIGQVYYPCSQVAGLSQATAVEAAGVAGGLAQCAGQGGLGLALVDGRDLSGNALIQAPKWTGYARAQYTLETDIGSFQFSTVGNYRSVAYFDTGNLFEDKKRFLLSAKASYTTPDERYSLSVSGENLTDVQYNTIKSPQNAGGWRVAAPPRWFYVTAGVQF